MFLVSDLPKLICLNEAHQYFLATGKTQCDSLYQQGTSTMWDCWTVHWEWKQPFLKCLLSLKCWYVEILCENVLVLQSTVVHIWVLFCLHYVLIELVDFHTWNCNIWVRCSIVAFKKDHKMHFQGYIALLFFLSFSLDFSLCSSVQLWIQRVFLVMVNFKVLLGVGLKQIFIKTF